MKTLLTSGSLARRADVPHARVAKLLKAGAMAPDFVAGRILLFEPARLSELLARLHPEQTNNLQS